MAKASRRSGTQSIERAVLLLKALSLRGALGWRLIDLANHCDLDRGTTHRILASLVRERLVRQRAGDRRYVLGSLIFELGLSLSALAEFQSVCSAPLGRIAKRFGGVAMLFLRSGTEFVCAARIDAAPLKALTIDAGTRRPLIVSAGGVAMLIAMPKDEARSIVAHNMKDVARFGHTRIQSLKRMLRRSEERGLGISQGDVVPGVSAFGMAIRDAAGAPFASISVVGAAGRFPSSRVAEVAAALDTESRWIAREAEARLGKFENPVRHR